MSAFSDFLHGGWNPWYDLKARLHRRRFEQIVILGFNCEPAFRFTCRWGFLDSGLFAWANSVRIGNLVAALRDLGAVGTGAMEYRPSCLMWKCLNSNVFFHGRLSPPPGSPPPGREELAADLEELRSRLAHLREKFLRYAANDASTLFVYKPNPDDLADPAFPARLAELTAALDALGARNWQLLVVCERRCLDAMPRLDRVLYRAVTRFNPTSRVTERKLGDPAGWQRIFSEFAPRRILRKSHAFKFEGAH